MVVATSMVERGADALRAIEDRRATARSSSACGSERPSVVCSHRPDAYWFADALQFALAAIFEADA